MPDIENTVESINSIAKKYKHLRQLSKTPTFALTYGGTWMAIVNQTGLPEDVAKQIEANYHDLYKESDQWVESKIQQASKDGYVTVAFGLRVRTPKIQQSLLNQSNTPFSAQAEARTAGNALGQSYGLLNNRAAIELQERCYNSPYAHLIKPIAHIHDAIYLLVKDDIDVVHWLSDNLVECMEWQDDPAIYHPDVKLGGDLSIFYPHWGNEIELKDKPDKETILKLCEEAKGEL